MDEDKLGLSPLPTGPTGKAVTLNGGAYWFINSKSSEIQQKAAFEYIKFMTSKDACIDYYKMLESTGHRAPIYSYFNDVDPGKYIRFNQDWLAVDNQAIAISRSETAMVEEFRPYINQVIERILVDKNANFDTLLNNAQNNAVNDIANPYNKKIKP